MVKIKGWHREEFAAGELENIPDDVRLALEAESKPGKKKGAKKKESSFGDTSPSEKSLKPNLDEGDE